MSENQNTAGNTPAHCHSCWKFAECGQAQNMMPDTQPVDAFMGNAEFLCGNCAGDDNEYIGDVGEVDSPSHCAVCGVPLVCSLTSVGVAYVKEKISENDGCCRELWPVLFADYLIA